MAKATALTKDAPQTEQPQPTPAIPLDVLNTIIEKFSEIKNSGGGITAEQLEAILERTGDKNAEALGRQFFPENKIAPKISAFSYPEGDTARPKPILRDSAGRPRETFFCGVRQSEDMLTPAEIDAFNSITEDKQARGGSWWAKVRRDGQTERLFVHVPCATVDERMSLPPLTAILFELASGKNALDIDALARQLADLREQLARAQQQNATSAE